MSYIPNSLSVSNFEKSSKRFSVVRVSDRPSKTNTDYAADADINVIAARFLKTGVMPTASSAPLVFGDVSLVPKGTDALMAVRNAQARFERFPSDLRKSIGSFANFEAWLRDPVNTDMAVKYGLLKRREVSKPSSGTPEEGAPVAQKNAPKGQPAPKKGDAGDSQT